MIRTTPTALKGHLDAAFIESWADRVIALGSDVDRDQFVESIILGYENLSFTQRSWKMAEALRAVLPENVPDALDQLISLLPQDAQPSDEGIDADGYWMWPIGDFIRLYGSDHIDHAMEACYELTKRFTAEFAIRPFLATRFDDCLPHLQRWVHDPNEHVRRLVSEGTRARLPWTTAIELPVGPILELLGELRADDSAYVRRSVANHLYDLSKTATDQTLDLAEQWLTDPNEHTEWIVRHALRDQFESRNQRALILFGFHPPTVEVERLVVPDEAKVGETIDAKFDISNPNDSEPMLVITVVVHFPRLSGKITPHNFDVKECQLGPYAIERYQKPIPLQMRLLRQKVIPGEHLLEIQVNGVVLAETSFVVRAA